MNIRKAMPRRRLDIPVHLVRDALVLAISERQVHVLQALRRRTFEEVVDCGVDDDALSRAMDCEATDFDTVLARNVADERGLADNLDKLLAGVTVLVDIADVSGGHGSVQRDGNGVLGSVSMK
jgi:hypothetical protein